MHLRCIRSGSSVNERLETGVYPNVFSAPLHGRRPRKKKIFFVIQVDVDVFVGLSLQSLSGDTQILSVLV